MSKEDNYDKISHSLVIRDGGPIEDASHSRKPSNHAFGPGLSQTTRNQAFNPGSSRQPVNQEFGPGLSQTARNQAFGLGSS
jgi:hypothetical protein